MQVPGTIELSDVIPAVVHGVEGKQLGGVIATDKPESVDELLEGLVERGFWIGVRYVQRVGDGPIKLLLNIVDYETLDEQDVKQVPRDVAYELNDVIRTRDYDLMLEPCAALRESGADVALEWAEENPRWYANAIVHGFAPAAYYYADVR